MQAAAEEEDGTDSDASACSHDSADDPPMRRSRTRTESDDALRPSFAVRRRQPSVAEITVEAKCAELVVTEGTYVEDMKLMLSAYVRPARILCLSNEDKRTIFSNIENLLMCNQALLERLGADGDPVDVLATGFLAVAPFFKMYSEYCKNYQAALATVQHCRESSPGFTEFLDQQLLHRETRGLSLESLIIKPIQRITKYPLFLGELTRAVPDDHPYFDKLARASALMQDVCSTVDKALSGDIRRLHELLAALSEGPELGFTQLLAPHRSIRLQATCLVVGGAKSFAAMAFVLNDLLILCETVPRAHGRAGASVTLPPLKPWLLWPLRGIQIDDEAIEGARGTELGHLAYRPTTEHTMLLRREEVGKEYLRMDFTTQATLIKFRDALEAERAHLDRLESDARRSNRRISMQLEPQVQRLSDALDKQWEKLKGTHRLSDVGRAAAAVAAAAVGSLAAKASPRESGAARESGVGLQHGASSEKVQMSTPRRVDETAMRKSMNILEKTEQTLSAPKAPSINAAVASSQANLGGAEPSRLSRVSMSASFSGWGATSSPTGRLSHGSTSSSKGSSSPFSGMRERAASASHLTPTRESSGERTSGLGRFMRGLSRSGSSRLSGSD